MRNIPGELGRANLFFVEGAAREKTTIHETERALLSVNAMKPQGDIRARCQVVALYIKNDTVRVRRTSCEELLGQMFKLGVGSHDDLNNALIYLLQGARQSGLGAADDSLEGKAIVMLPQET